MQVKFVFTAVFAALVLFVSSAASAITIEVGYPYSALFDVTIKDTIVPMFEKAHPGIKVKPVSYTHLTLPTILLV